MHEVETHIRARVSTLGVERQELLALSQGLGDDQGRDLPGLVFTDDVQVASFEQDFPVFAVRSIDSNCHAAVGIPDQSAAIVRVLQRRIAPLRLSAIGSDAGRTAADQRSDRTERENVSEIWLSAVHGERRRISLGKLYTRRLRAPQSVPAKNLAEGRATNSITTRGQTSCASNDKRNDRVEWLPTGLVAAVSPLSVSDVSRLTRGLGAVATVCAAAVVIAGCADEEAGIAIPPVWYAQPPGGEVQCAVSDHSARCEARDARWQPPPNAPQCEGETRPAIAIDQARDRAHFICWNGPRRRPQSYGPHALFRRGPIRCARQPGGFTCVDQAQPTASVLSIPSRLLGRLNAISRVSLWTKRGRRRNRPCDHSDDAHRSRGSGRFPRADGMRRHHQRRPTPTPVRRYKVDGRSRRL